MIHATPRTRFSRDASREKHVEHDKHANLDAMGKLRNVYPNVLHLEKPGMIGDSQQQQLRREQLKRSETEMFGDFFQQTMGLEINQFGDSQGVLDLRS